MKRLFSLLLFCGTICSSCNNDKKITHTEKNEDGSTTTTSFEPEKFATDADGMNKKIEELKKLKPMSVDELKAILPEEINGIKRTDFNANTAMGFAVAEANYQKDDTTNVKLSIYDCAGEVGAGMFGMMYWTKMNVQSESSDGYTKTVDFDGGKAVENYSKGSNESTLTYVKKDRLLVVLTGRNMDNSALEAIAKGLNFKG